MLGGRAMAAPLLLAALACQSDTTPTPPAPEYPAVDALPDRPPLPDIFTGKDGRKVTTPDDLLTWRAQELRGLFAHYIYGVMPPPPGGAVTITAEAHAELLGGTVVYDEWAVGFLPSGTKPIHLALFAPKGASKPPVILGPNKCGNQSLVDDPAIRMTDAFVHPDCGPLASSRGVQSTLWPVGAITGRGFALATFHESDAAPDQSDRVADGLLPHFTLPGEPETHWGMISAWTWATSRAVDALVDLAAKEARVDAKRIAVFGHSRRGKAALWSGANDPRIALVIAHQSGTGGAALSRSLVGESIYAINLFFPHWFDDVFPTFANHETRLPIDQHELLALLAPRPVLLVDGDADEWADPPGARAAAEAASPAWKLFGDPGLVLGTDGMPKRDAKLVWTTRPGTHGVTPSDWTIFLDFAALHFGLP